MKVLFICILDKNECEQKLYSEFVKSGFNGTLLQTTSIKHALLDNSVEPMPIFAGLRHLVDHKEIANTTIFMVIDLDKLEEVKSIVNRVTNNLENHSGIMFAMPLIMIEGAIK